MTAVRWTIVGVWMVCAWSVVGCREQSKECSIDSECDDQNPCSDDRCVSGGCVRVNNSALCDDGSACTQDDRCLNGACAGEAVVCDDRNGCTDDSCDPKSGCVFSINSAPCEDGSACTVGDICKQGSCTSGSARDCDDQNPCTDDSCDLRQGCLHTLSTGACDDGNACNIGDTCVEGACIPGSQTVDCDDHNLCTDDSCDPTLGCQNQNNILACNDKDACTNQDTCTNGVCVGAPINCDDGSGCTSDSCDTIRGCLHTNACDHLASCVNLACVCKQGYQGSGFTCVDANECSQGTDQCDVNADCTNTEGSYTCRCRNGYYGDGFVCHQTSCADGICSDDETMVTCPSECTFDLVVVVAPALLPNLQTQLEQYRADLAVENKRVKIESFTGTDAQQLRAQLVAAVADHGVQGAFLLGNLPAAWYEQTAFQTFEQFPMDIYLIDPDSTWADADHNGKFDSHGPLEATIFVSRLMGDLSLLQSYFGKLHAYRTTGSLADNSAYIFLDDDWTNYYGNYSLDGIYTSIDLVYNTSATTKAAYISKMTGTGAEFVYQWIHSDPYALYIAENGNYNLLYASEFQGLDPKGSFYNLFDCSASRFTENNFLAQTYILKTTRGLATIGSAKTGGIYAPETFHGDLASGYTWGEAFLNWYNTTGRYNDEWHLGIVIMGDPMLTVSGTTRSSLAQISPRVWTRQELEQLAQTMMIFSQNSRLGTFEEYRAKNPQFFTP